MKKLFAVAVLGVAVAATAAVSNQAAAPASATAQVDLDQVNARIDARLHHLLGQLVAQRGR